jgi:hypothetical protein
MNLGEDLKKIVFCVMNVLDESFSRFDWPMVVLRLNGSQIVTTMLEYKIASLPRTTLLRIRNIISDQNEDYLISVRNRNETI